MKRIICIALLLISTTVMADESYEPCVKDTRSTTVKVFNGITWFFQTIDPTVWAARGILALIPGKHQEMKATKYCDSIEPQETPEAQPETAEAPAATDSEGTAN